MSAYPAKFRFHVVLKSAQQLNPVKSGLLHRTVVLASGDGKSHGGSTSDGVGILTFADVSSICT